MRKQSFLARVVTGILVLTLWTGFHLGCAGGSPCTQLSARCDKCSTIQQPGCKAIVAAGKDAACQDSLKLFDSTGQCQ